MVPEISLIYVALPWAETLERSHRPVLIGHFGEFTPLFRIMGFQTSSFHKLSNALYLQQMAARWTQQQKENREGLL